MYIEDIIIYTLHALLISWCHHVGLISEHKYPIVTMQFLNQWGDRQIVPYHMSKDSSMRVDGRGSPIHYFSIVAKNVILSDHIEISILRDGFTM